MTYILDPIADVLRILVFQVEQMLMLARSSVDRGLGYHLVEVMFHMSDQIWILPCHLHLLLLLRCRLVAELSHAQGQKRCLAGLVNHRSPPPLVWMHLIGFVHVLFVQVSMLMTTICARRTAMCRIQAPM